MRANQPTVQLSLKLSHHVIQSLAAGVYSIIFSGNVFKPREMKNYLPKTRIDCAAMAITAFFSPVAIIHAMYLLTQLYPNGASDPDYGWNYILHCVFSWFLWINCLVQLIRVIFMDSSISNLTLPIILQEGWRYCSMCQLNAPLRSHHCVVCDTCIIRRDHHCYYTGRCIGLVNHKAFVAGLTYGSLSAIYAVALSLAAIMHVESNINAYKILTVIFPVLAWMVGFTEANLLFTLLGSLALFGGLASFIFLLLQLWAIAHGQTFYEYRMSISDYNQGFIKNFKDVLGENWWFYWILPWIPSRVPGDGSHYLEVRNRIASNITGKDVKSL